MPSIIQLFHPGPEHGYDKSLSKNGQLLKDWHVSVNKNGKPVSHKRKFLSCKGSYIIDGIKKNGDLLFWGEWEPPSHVEKLEQSECIENPKFLHTPFIPDQLSVYQNDLYNGKHRYQNTDPFVFGKYFMYSNCMQKKKSLRELEEGSLIIFGSKVNMHFVIDTVFVVKEAAKYHCLDDVEKMNTGLFPEIVTKFITDDKNRVNEPFGFTLYKSVTFDDREAKAGHGMYSFVPAKVNDGTKKGFPRFIMLKEFYHSEKPEIKAFRTYFQKPLGGQNIKKSDNISSEEIYNFWKYIKDEISKEYVLGYNFKMPGICHVSFG